MSRIISLFLLVVSITLCTEASSVSIFGPRRYDRTTGKPNTYQDNFILAQGATAPFTLTVTNGAPDGSDRISSGTITLNGVQIIKQSDFNQQVGTIQRVVSLNANNTIKVELSSKPGSYLTINIVGQGGTTIPVLSITQPLDGFLTGTSPVSVTGTVNGTTPITVTANSSPMTVTASGVVSGQVALVEGSNTINFIATDATGGSSTVVRRIILDSQPPIVNLTSPIDNLITNQTSIIVSGTETDSTTVAVTVNGTSVQISNGSFSVPFALVEGLNTIAVVATDAAGNQTTVTRTVRRDNQPPVLTMTQPVDGLITNQLTVLVIGTVTDLPDGQAGESSLTVTINGNPVILEAGGVINTTAALVEGLNTITITASDTVNNQTTVIRTVRRDTQSPVLNLISPIDSVISNLQSILVSGTVTDSTAVELTVNGELLIVGTDGAFSYQLPIVEGKSTITVVATDKAGNNTSISRTIIRDTQSPVLNIASPIDSTITNISTVTISGTVADTLLESLTVAGSPVTVNSDGSFSTQINLIEGLNVIVVLATDKAGNNSTITRILILDTVVPTVPVLSLADSITTNQSSIIISGTISDSTKIKVTANGLTLPVAADGSFSGEIPLVEGINVISIVVTDAASNQTTLERSIWRDSVSPVITFTSQIDSLATKDSSVIIAGSVSDLSSVYFTVNGVAQILNPDHSFVLEVALVEGLNRIIMIAADAAGNETRDTINVIRDTQAPIVTLASPIDGFITNLQSVIVSGTINDLTTVSLTINSLAQTINPDGTFSQTFLLGEGENIFNIVVTDALGNTSSTSRKVVRDSKPPVLSIVSLANNIQTTDSVVTILGSVGDSTNIQLMINGAAQVLSPNGGFRTSVFLTYGSNTITFVAIDQADNTITADRTIIRVPLPPDPKTVAPPIDTTVSTLVMDATEFLYTGSDPIQKGVAEGTINKLHVTVLRGKVLDKALQPLSGAKVTILGSPEFGYTFSREDGMYDIAVNGGAEVKINFEKVGYLPAQRQVTASWAAYASVDDAVLMQLDTVTHQVDFVQPEMVQGTPATDSLGTRRPTLFFNQGTQAKLVFTAYNYKVIDGCVEIFQYKLFPIPSKVIPMPYDSLVNIGSVALRASEYTVGPNAETLLPAPLPPTVAMTFAFELTADEVLSTGARDVRFSQPVSLYLENIMNFPVGLTVPMGCYNREKGFWETSDNGRVIKIISRSGGIAAIDYNGDNIAEPADTLAAKGISLVEQQYLATIYSAGQSIWRAEITHLGTYAGGFGMIAPNAKDPQNPLPDRYAKVDRDNILAGSVIGVQNQTLGESLPITNTPMTMSYKSDRVFGRREAYCLDIPLTGKTIPQGMSIVSLSIEILGRKIDSAFTPRPNLTYHFEWDGKDAYGRRVQGQQNILTEIAYSFPAQYTIPPDVSRCFATPSGQIMERYIPARKEIRRTQIWEGKIGAFDILSLGIGGWSLSLHHGYDCVGKVLYKGDGGVRSANVMDNVINTVAGVSSGAISSKCDPSGWVDGKLAAQTKIGVPCDIQFASDGSLYYSDNLGTVNKIDTMGILSVIAGRYGGCWMQTPVSDSATGIMANCISLQYLSHIAQGPDKCLYVSDIFKHVIWKISPEGERTRFAGVYYKAPDGPYKFGGDGGPALNAYLARPRTIAFGKDGCLYVADEANYRIRKISPDGIITTITGQGSRGFTGDGGPAINASISEPRGLAVGPDGSIYIADYVNQRIRRITPDGIIRTFAGNGANGNTGDGGLATQARIAYPMCISAGKDGTIYLSSTPKVRGVATDGYIKTIVGGGNTRWVENGPATSTNLSGEPRINYGPDDNLYVSEDVVGVPGGALGPRIFKVNPPLPGITLSEILIASEDGSERYVFTYSGRHLRTLDALTGVVKYNFGYDDQYRLVTITDVDSLVTHVERDSTGKATAIISPYGVRTQLNLDSLGYLLQAVNPASESRQFTYTDDGLMTSMTDARNNTYHYEYDSLGYLTKDLDPVGGYTNLKRVYDSTGYTITSTTAMGKKTIYRSEKSPDGTRRFINIDANGLKTITVDSTDGSSYTITPEGMNRPSTEKPDPRFGMQSPLVNATAKTPGGLQSNVNQFRTITQMTGTAVTGLQDSISVNGKPFKTVWDGSQRMMTKISAEGRRTFSYYNAKGRVIKDSTVGLTPMLYNYDSFGRKIQTLQGGRVTLYSYDSLGRKSQATDSYGRSTQYYYEGADRLIRIVNPDLSELTCVYDRNGNITALTPPGQSEHTFESSKVDLKTLYTPPFAGDSARSTSNTYTLDQEMLKILRPDSLNITLEYGGKGSLAGQPKKIYFDRGVLTNMYDTTKALLVGVVSPIGDSLRYQYDGKLLKKVTWTGNVKGNVAFSYNSDIQVSTETVIPAIGNADSINLKYDKDGLLTSIGAMQLKYGTANTLLVSDTVGGVITNYAYDLLGKLASKETKFSSVILCKIKYQRDSLGRITEKIENLQGVSTKYNYGYDVVGRLSEVKKNDTVYTAYEYDQNGNMLLKVTQTDTTRGMYDAQDRILTYGETSYIFSPFGNLKMKAQGIDTTRYNYDAFGSLMSVQLSDGTLIEYLIDGAGKRVGRKINGIITNKWLYSDSLRIVAEIDSANRIVSRFVYTSSENVPEYMVKSGIVYRIITDHLGSVKQIINTQTGTIVQQIDFDEYGNVLTDSNPGFTPFGFAGGLFDTRTKLVRFGARDYDAIIGRWTCKDPALFIGKSTNLYRYVSCNPVNLKDPNGLFNNLTFEVAVHQFNQAFLKMAMGFFSMISGAVEMSKVVAVPSWGWVAAYGTLGAVEWAHGFNEIGEATFLFEASLKNFVNAQINADPVTSDIEE